MQRGAVRVLSSIFITTLSDTRNKECLQKISLEQLLFKQGTFPGSLFFEDIYFLERTSFFVL